MMKYITERTHCACLALAFVGMLLIGGGAVYLDGVYARQDLVCQEGCGYE